MKPLKKLDILRKNLRKMEALQFNLIAPEKTLFAQPIQMAVIPGIQGDIGVLPGHAPLLTLLRAGVVKIYEKNKSMVEIFVDGGFAEVTPDKCMALITSGTPLEALDKHSLELEIKNLLEDRESSVTAKEREKVEKKLAIAQTKLMTTLSSLR